MCLIKSLTKFVFGIIIIVGFNLWSMDNDDDQDNLTGYSFSAPKRKLSTGKENANPGNASKKKKLSEESPFAVRNGDSSDSKGHKTKSISDEGDDEENSCQDEDLSEAENTAKSPITFLNGELDSSPCKAIKDGGVGYKLRHFSVYSLIGYYGDDYSYIPNQKERINFGNILGGKNLVNDSNLNEFLLALEIKVRNWIKNNPLLYYRAGYVGLAENASKRVHGHRSDLKALKSDDDGYTVSRYSPNRKARYIASLFDKKMRVRMSSLVYNIPYEYLPVVEVLVGLQFNVLSKGSTKLGDDAAWAIILKYMHSEARKDKLSKLGLFDLVEKLDDEHCKFACKAN